MCLQTLSVCSMKHARPLCCQLSSCSSCCEFQRTMKPSKTDDGLFDHCSKQANKFVFLLRALYSNKTLLISVIHSAVHELNANYDAEQYSEFT